MNYIEEFLEKHPIYKTITFSSTLNPVETNLHPILPASQAIIDLLLEAGHKRIAIVLPDDSINILPLVVSKYLSNIQERPEYAHNLFEDIEPGQHLKLGKAVVEFISFDKNNKIIETYVGKPTKKKFGSTVYIQPPTKHITPFQSYHLYFERTNGALSKEATFNNEKRELKEYLKKYGMADIDHFAMKRTVLNKTVVILSPKKEFVNFLDGFFISSYSFEDVVTYGEFDTATEQGTKLYNTGRLDCLPGLIVAPKISEIVSGISKEEMKEKVDTIVVTQAKYNEVINNRSDFKKCLKTGIPFIMYVPETEFETFPVLAEMGFEFWNWDPHTLYYGGLSSNGFIAPDNSLFNNLSKKVFNAATSEIELKTFKYDGIKKANGLIRQVIKKTFESSSAMKQVARRLNKIVKAFIDLASPVTDSIKQSLINQFDEIKTIQSSLQPHYEGTDIWEEIQRCIDILRFIFEKGDTPKQRALYDLIKSTVYKNIIVLVPDRYAFVDELQEYVNNTFLDKKVLVMHTRDFILKQASTPIETDHLMVTFFDQSEYIHIKKSYCYKRLTYLLYTFENAWRRGFLDRYENCLQRDMVKQHASSIFSQQDMAVEWGPVEPVESSSNADIEEISEFDFERKLITNIIKRNNTSAERSDSAECIPVAFDRDTIGYISPNHNLIDITLLCHGEYDSPVKKEASKLCKGDIVLIRQSDKDIIYDKANELMMRKGESSLRDTSELWVLALQKYAEGKPLDVIKNNMNVHGANCDSNQIRYWLTGDTICPENSRVVTALSNLCPEILPKDKVSSVLSAGAKVQDYHRAAGRWLTSELKFKANDILDIYQSGNANGYIDGIGDVHVYVVEAVFDREYVDRNKINKLEEIS